MDRRILKRIESTDHTTQEIVDLSTNAIRLLNEIDDQESALLVRSVLFLSLAIRDEVAVLQAYMKGSNKWSRVYQLRGAILQMFEIGDDLPSVFGKKFRGACCVVKCSDEIIQSFDAEIKKLNKFRSHNEKNFKHIRDTAAAHRDHDPIEMLEKINKIDQNKTFMLIVSHLKLMNAFQKSLVPVLRVVIKNKERTKEQIEDVQETIQSLLAEISRLRKN